MIAPADSHANAAALIVRPQTPDEFAETLVDKVIVPIIVTPDPARLTLKMSTPEVRVEPSGTSGDRVSNAAGTPIGTPTGATLGDAARYEPTDLQPVSHTG